MPDTEGVVLVPADVCVDWEISDIVNDIGSTGIKYNKTMLFLGTVRKVPGYDYQCNYCTDFEG